MRMSRVALALAASVLVFGVAVSSASANRLSTSNPGIRITWTEMILGGNPTRCAVTMEGTLHSKTYAKTGGLLIGYITRVSIARPCANGEAWFLTTAEGQTMETLPWHIRYDSFVGTLPNGITSVKWQFVGMAFRIRTELGGFCLAQTTNTNPAFLILGLTTGTVTSARWDEIREIPWVCIPAAGLWGSGRMTLLSTTTAITVTLI